VHDRRAHLVDEHERADAAGLQGGHGAAYFQAADVVDARGDDGGHAGVLAGRDQGRQHGMRSWRAHAPCG